MSTRPSACGHLGIEKSPAEAGPSVLRKEGSLDFRRMANSGAEGRFLRKRALATRVTRVLPQSNRVWCFALLRCAALSGRRLDKFSSSRRRSGRQLLNILDAIAKAGDGA